MIKEKEFIHTINRKNFPLFASFMLLLITSIAFIVLKLLHGQNEDLWVIGGIDLLLYLILNSVCAMVVKNITTFVLRTMLAYIINLLGIMVFIVSFTWHSFYDYAQYFPMFTAYVFAFFISIGLIVLIRQILVLLND